MRVTVIGAGVAGLACATELAESGAKVEVIERGAHLGATTCSWLAGAMLAPWCEAESAPAVLTVHGQVALDWWSKRYPGTQRHGTLVVAPPRDTGELQHFARRAEAFEWIDGDHIEALEPDLAGRFSKALYFAGEGHLDPRLALAALADRLRQLGGEIRFGVNAEDYKSNADWIIDCRGFAAAEDLKDLRGVRGEMLLIRTSDVTLSRPVRMLHPRFPLYIVPRADGVFMVGATMIESAERGPPTARSMLELLNAAVTLHPAFGEAEILEIGADVRPAFPDNLPAIRRSGHTIYLNGMYRHGFLLAPWLAQRVAGIVLKPSSTRENCDDDHLERREA